MIRSGYVDDNTRLMKSLLFQLVEMDWCIGYEMTEGQHVALDDIRTKAAMLLQGEPVDDGYRDMAEGISKMIANEDCGGDGWWDGFKQAVAGRDKASA